MSAFAIALPLGKDGIYTSPSFGREQELELSLRRQVAQTAPADLLAAISQHHSIPVMDREVEIFVRSIPVGGTIIDVGGCWGWHWRHLPSTRPDLTVVIVDLVRENLTQAQRLLGAQIGKQVHLVHGDALNLPFASGSVDGYWSVQTWQHIRDFSAVATEAHRVLKSGGQLATYNLNRQAPIQWLYARLAKDYPVRGMVAGRYYLARAHPEQRQILAQIFAGPVTVRYSEILFKPELNWHRPGSRGTLSGWLDSRLSSSLAFWGYWARQQSYHLRRL